MRYLVNENNFSTSSEQFLETPETLLTESSRREFVQLLMLGAAGLLIPAGIANASYNPQDLHKEFERVAGLVTKVLTEEPNLPGVRNAEKSTTDLLPQKLTEQDAEVLQGALYLKALKLLNENQQRKAQSPTLATIRAVFTDPEPMSCIKQDHVTNLLQATQMKMSKQPSFAREVKAASETLKMRTRFKLTGDSPPMSSAFVIIVIIIIIIIIASASELH